MNVPILIAGRENWIGRTDKLPEHFCANYESAIRSNDQENDRSMARQLTTKAIAANLAGWFV